MLSVLLLPLLALSLGSAQNVPKRIYVQADPRYKWPNGEVIYAIDNTPESKKYSKEIQYAVEYWQSWTCLKFKKIDNLDEISDKTNVVIFSYTEGSDACVRMLQEPIVNFPPHHRFVFFKRYCSYNRDLVFQMGFAIGLAGAYTQNLAPLRFTPAFEDIRDVNLLYNCNSTCMFLPECKNGGYADPKADFGCGKCLCPQGQTCQDKEEVKPNLAAESMNKASTDRMKNSIKEVTNKKIDKHLPDKYKGSVGAGAAAIFGDIISGEVENIPADVTAGVAESLLCNKLEKVLSKAKTGGSIAGALAAAAGSVIGDILKGDYQNALKNALKVGLSAYVGNAIGAVIGSAIGGPIGTVIGSIIGGYIASYAEVLIGEIIDFLCVVFKKIYEFIVQQAQAFYGWLTRVFSG